MFEEREAVGVMDVPAVGVCLSADKMPDHTIPGQPWFRARCSSEGLGLGV